MIMANFCISILFKSCVNLAHYSDLKKHVNS